MTTDRDELELGHGERLPWLETAEDHDARQRKGWGTVVAALLGVAALMLVIGAIWYSQQARQTTGDGELIAAPQGDYKVRADGKDGMTVDSESDAMLAASEGQEASGRIATAEPTPGATSTKPAAEIGSGTEVATSSPAPTTRPAPSGASVQLGAFADQPSAEAEWTRIARAEPSVAKLTRSIETVAAGGKSVFRLRAAVADAAAGRAVCSRLQPKNIACFTVR